MISVALLLIPFVSAFLLLAGPKQNSAKWAIVPALLQLIGTVMAYCLHYRVSGGADFNLDLPWITSPNIHFHLGMDGVGFLMVLLVNLTVPFIVLSAFNRNIKRSNIYFFLIFFMQFALIGVFLAMDGLLYYVFWELTLIPAYFILMYWGGENRAPVTLKFFIYTLAGSLCMMLGFIYLYHAGSHSLDVASLVGINLPANVQCWLFAAFFLAFAIKVPIFPFHTWQSETYKTAPAQGTMLLSALMAKMGLFSIFRWLLPLFPLALADWGNVVLVLCTIGVLYGSVIAIRQKDLKRLFAYVSLAHMGLMAAGLFSLNKNGISGGMVQAFAHGINTVGLFICADIIQNRMHGNNLEKLGGIRKVAPAFASVFLIIVLASIALPLTNSFVSELVLMSGVFANNAWIGGLVTLSIVFGAVYMLRMYKNAMLGETNEHTEHFKDLTTSEKWTLYPIVVLIIFFGFVYQPLFDLTGPAIDQMLQHIQH